MVVGKALNDAAKSIVVNVSLNVRCSDMSA